jgi:acetyl-CoA carboxylase biotin carboxyl carrier protein
MKPSEIKDLIDFIDKSNLDEVNIETEQFKITAKKNSGKVIVEAAPAPVVYAAPVAQPAPQAVPSVTPSSAATPAAAQPPVSAPAESGKKLVEIKSPMIGTFYRSSSPDTPVFVNVGDEVKKEQTVVCIIEAMKLFNEIESTVSGRIARILVENATPVEFDQVLFLVEAD